MSELALSKTEVSLGDMEMNPGEAENKKNQSVETTKAADTTNNPQPNTEKKKILASGCISSVFIIIFAVLIAAYLVIQHEFRANIDDVIHVRFIYNFL